MYVECCSQHGELLHRDRAHRAIVGHRTFWRIW
eukprot:COSAG05_NODE_5735_length_1102_cov_1.042871_1_plen_32_part_10